MSKTEASMHTSPMQIAGLHGAGIDAWELSRNGRTRKDSAYTSLIDSQILGIMATGGLDAAAAATGGNPHGKTRNALKYAACFGGRGDETNGAAINTSVIDTPLPSETPEFVYEKPDKSSDSGAQPKAEEKKKFEIDVSFGPKVTIDMFDPDSSKVKMPLLLRRFLGREALEYASFRFATPEQRRIKKLKDLQRNPQVTAKHYNVWNQRRMNTLQRQIDFEGMSNAISESYGLRSYEDPMSFYERQMRHAHAVRKFVLSNTAPRFRAAIGQKTEPELILTGRQDFIDFTFDPGTDDRAQMETRFDLLLGIPCAEVDIYVRRSGLDERLREVSRLFNEKLFVGKRGTTRRRDFAVVHDRITNRALRYEELVENVPLDNVPHNPATERVRPFPIDMRTFKDSGIMALYDTRPKEIPATIVKAIQEALDRKREGGDGTVYPLQDVEDLMGIKFIVDDKEDPKAVENAMLQVFGVLVDNGIGLDVIPDDKTNGTSDQSKDFRWKRIKLMGMGDNNLPVIFEIVFQGVLVHINNEREVGVFDHSKGRFMGQFHAGYNSERLIKGEGEQEEETDDATVKSVAKFIYPPGMYDTGNIPIDIVEQTKDTKNRKAHAELL